MVVFLWWCFRIVCVVGVFCGGVFVVFVWWCFYDCVVVFSWRWCFCSVCVVVFSWRWFVAVVFL